MSDSDPDPFYIKNKSDDPDPDETNPQHSTNKFKIETLDKNVVDRVYDLH